jgi:hypothetical protein
MFLSKKRESAHRFKLLPPGAVVSGKNVLCFYQKREKAHTTAQPVIPLLDSGNQENRKERD